MERPSTSRARGVCKYYATRNGCFNGSLCKFLHGSNETLSPYDKGKICRFFAEGFCKHGDKCWFRHESSTSLASAFEVSNSNAEASSSRTAENEDICCICQEKPVTYGLLTGCSHICCLKCIRTWRDSAGRSSSTLSDNTKKCPYCREQSNFVIPSSIFYPENDPMKAIQIEKYKASMSRVPCKHFQKSSPMKRFCPYGRDCFYQHKEDDGSLVNFSYGISSYVDRNRGRSQEQQSQNLASILRHLRARLDSFLAPSNDNDDDSDETPANIMDNILGRIGATLSLQENELQPRSSSPDSLAPRIFDENLPLTTSPLPLTRSAMEIYPIQEELTPLPSPSLRRSGAIRRASRSPSLGLNELRGMNIFDLFADEESIHSMNNGRESPGYFRPSEEQFEFAARVDQPDASRILLSPDGSESDESTTSSHAGVVSLQQPSSPGIEFLSSPVATDNPSAALSPLQHDEPQCEPELDSTDTVDPVIRFREADRDVTKTETRRDTRRTKPHPGIVSSSERSRRNNSQIFVTDGRGRVVATDDGNNGGSSPFTFWGNTFDTLAHRDAANEGLPD